MILEENYNAAVDWWALGIIVYLMATGHCPFYCGKSTYRAVDSTLFATPYYPSYLSNDTQDFIQKLLCKTPSQHLGKEGDIRRHPFFTSIDWKELELHISKSTSVGWIIPKVTKALSFVFIQGEL
ncbi:kinase C delta type-like, partial [Pelobates cultripes]